MNGSPDALTPGDLGSPGVPASPLPGAPLGVLGVLGAIEQEVRLVREHLVDATEHRFGRLPLWQGFLDTDTERRQPLVVARCGVGKVNAAIAVCALAGLGVREAVFTGVAGALAPDLGVGDFVVATDLVQHDVDVTALGRVPGELIGEPVSWPADPTLAAQVLDAARAAAPTASVRPGRIASGDQFIASGADGSRIRGLFGADAAEMEGAAFAQACAAVGIAGAVVRVMSDTADGGAVVDFQAFLHVSADIGLDLVRALVASRVADPQRP